MEFQLSNNWKWEESQNSLRNPTSICPTDIKEVSAMVKFKNRPMKGHFLRSPSTQDHTSKKASNHPSSMTESHF